jgi:hypothetical protein
MIVSSPSSTKSTLFAKLSGALESMFGGGEWFCTTHEGPCKNKRTKTVCRLFIMQRQYSSCKGKTRVPRVRARRRQRVRAIKPKAAWTRESRTRCAKPSVSDVDSNQLSLRRVYTGIWVAFFFGGGALSVAPGRGNATALSPGPSSEHPAAWRRAPGWSSNNPMTEGAQHEELRTRGARDLTSHSRGSGTPPPPRVCGRGWQNSLSVPHVNSGMWSRS